MKKSRNLRLLELTSEYDMEELFNVYPQFKEWLIDCETLEELGNVIPNIFCGSDPFDIRGFYNNKPMWGFVACLISLYGNEYYINYKLEEPFEYINNVPMSAKVAVIDITLK